MSNHDHFVAHTHAAEQGLNRTRFERYGSTVQGIKPGPATRVTGFARYVNDPETGLACTGTGGN